MIKKLYLEEKSFLFYLLGLSIFLLYFIYALFDKSILIEKNTYIIVINLLTPIFFFIGFILDSIKFIKRVWSNFYGKIFHFIVASVVYALSYSLSEKIIFINTQIDPNFLQSSIHLFSALLNLPVWILTFQIILIFYTIAYFLIFFAIFLLWYVFLFFNSIYLEITKTIRDLIHFYLLINLFYKNKQIRVNLKIIKKKTIIKKRLLVKKCIHSFFFILGGCVFLTFLPMDSIMLNSKLLKENNIIKEIIVFTSFYKSNNSTCNNLDKNRFVRFYGNKFSKVKRIDGKIIFVNNIECQNKI
ncbi:MAG: hypothetical protein WA916_12390 [Arcobacter sp.]|uniref:hypothetical protein n=1 Tax=Arcobacter sp. TaxID=1872629 RepID=UPI003C746479